MTKSLKRIILVTDAWSPQVNGVVTTLQRITKELERFGVDVKVIQPSDPGHKYMPLPTYPEIPMVWSSPDMESRILSFKPDAIYIATEGGLGWKARKICQKHQLPFVTGFHTKYPEYIHKRFYIPTSWVYRLMKYFHQPAAATLVPSQSLKDELEGRGFKALRLMSRGVQTDVFSPNAKTDLGLPKPVCLYVGRVATEKNLEAFLSINMKGSKVIVGDGPHLETLQKNYPDAIFVGVKKGCELAQYYASADVFVFPSLTDTFGIVNIEAIACGTPVAAFPVTGPRDIVTQGVNGYLSDNLHHAIEQALRLKGQIIHTTIDQYTWSNAAQQFLNQLVRIDWTRD